MTFTSLRALHKCIGDDIDDLENLYKERSRSDPLDFPSMDVPRYAKAPRSAHEEATDELNAEPSVVFAIRRIKAACGQLTATVDRPWDALMDAVRASQLSACLRFMEAAHIVEILREAGPNGMHVKDLCRSVKELRPGEKDAPDQENLNPERLGHILRVLATSHWLLEVSPDVFANNRRSSLMDTGKSLEELHVDAMWKYADTNGAAAAVGQVGDYASKVSVYLTEWLLPDTRVGSDSIDAIESTGDIHTKRTSTQIDRMARYLTPFNLAFGTKLGFFQWLELPENRHRLVRFGHAMKGTSQWETKHEFLDAKVTAFPWKELPQGAILVDVGGGVGSTSMAIAQAYSHIHVVVEDREQVVDNAPNAWGPEHQPLLKSGRVTWRSRDFFAKWEPLALKRDPNVFLLRLILHNWQDEDSVKILRRLRAAAGLDTKIIIGDMLLPHACISQDALIAHEHSPLLPNLGVASIQGYLIDVMQRSVP
ncbi:S-adenosyl-L-methionine-dependent methyltransferase [Cubamyces menziesii]|nr:S-adenosyl-L-methionine-dependent methyltransferase [Cubamyces menziesii]